MHLSNILYKRGLGAFQIVAPQLVCKGHEPLDLFYHFSHNLITIITTFFFASFFFVKKFNIVNNNSQNGNCALCHEQLHKVHPWIQTVPFLYEMLRIEIQATWPNNKVTKKLI